MTTSKNKVLLNQQYGIMGNIHGMKNIFVFDEFADYFGLEAFIHRLKAESERDFKAANAVAVKELSEFEKRQKWLNSIRKKHDRWGRK